MCHLFEPHADFSWIQNPIVPSRVSVLLIVTFLLEFFLANRRARSANTNLAENLVLAVFFWTLPALVGIGFYFTFWHGLRHVLRLIKFESIIWPSFVIQAALPTLGAVLIMVILGATTNFQALASMDYLAVYLAVIAGLTVPHSLIVCWMDEKAGVWSTLKN
jgi:Brp/Blh family beta-carotene 15,15'-monooxygenase